MFFVFYLKEAVRVPDTWLFHDYAADPKQAILRALKEEWAARIEKEIGYVIMVLDVTNMQAAESKDDKTTYMADFSVLTFYPRIGEIIEGEIVEINNFGAYVRVACTDAILHLGNVFPNKEAARADVKRGTIVGQRSGRVVKLGSKIRARITRAGFATAGNNNDARSKKIEISCNEESLGARYYS